jgi:hypothetical protein
VCSIFAEFFVVTERERRKRKRKRKRRKKSACERAAIGTSIEGGNVKIQAKHSLCASFSELVFPPGDILARGFRSLGWWWSALVARSTWIPITDNIHTLFLERFRTPTFAIFATSGVRL